MLKISLAMILLGRVCGWAADTIRPLDIKPGQWESTMTMQTSGDTPVPPQVLATLNDQQRAKMEEQLKPRTLTRKTCVKRETLDKPLNMGYEDKACSRTLVSSSANKQEIHVECGRQTAKSSGSIRVEAVDSENFKGVIEMSVMRGDQSTNITSIITGHWIGAACGKEN